MNFSKLTSGKFLLTVICGICFFLLTKTFCNVLLLKIDDIKINDLLPYISAILIVLSNIFTFYFTKKG